MDIGAGYDMGLSIAVSDSETIRLLSTRWSTDSDSMLQTTMSTRCVKQMNLKLTQR